MKNCIWSFFCPAFENLRNVLLASHTYTLRLITCSSTVAAVSWFNFANPQRATIGTAFANVQWYLKTDCKNMNQSCQRAHWLPELLARNTFLVILEIIRLDMGRISSNLLIKKAFASMPFFLLASRQLGVNIAKLFICFKEPLRFLETTFLDKINGTSGPPSPPPPPLPFQWCQNGAFFALSRLHYCFGGRVGVCCSYLFCSILLVEIAL